MALWAARIADHISSSDWVRPWSHSGMKSSGVTARLFLPRFTLTSVADTMAAATSMRAGPSGPAIFSYAIHSESSRASIRPSNSETV